ncbi:chloramphenicol 3-O phosphotransferase [Catenulispora sp. GP43]|uniref:chloramphenicol phosphotransferase CPT n=1 Tax=Catenulispora sp. GP43 TaxID=3156263 RepID=UPI00351530E2
MTAHVIILNGGSSYGKTSITRYLQAALPDAWLAFGIDGFVDALPPRMLAADAGLQIGDGGEVSVGADFHMLAAAWMAGVAATARAGAKVVVDDVFLGGAVSQQRWERALGDLDVLWVGVRCDGRVAADRESLRGDRTPGMAELQADLVHRGVRYDLEVDTTDAAAADCARIIAARVS